MYRKENGREEMAVKKKKEKLKEKKIQFEKQNEGHQMHTHTLTHARARTRTLLIPHPPLLSCSFFDGVYVEVREWEAESIELGGWGRNLCVFSQPIADGKTGRTTPARGPSAAF